MKIKEREKNLIMFLAGVLGVAFLGNILFGPFHARFVALGKEIAVEEARFKKGIGLVEKKEEIDSKYEKYASFFSLLGASDEEAIAAFLREIEQLARESGLTILDMKPQKEVEKDKIAFVYKITVKAEGQMSQLTNFLYQLYSCQLAFSVDKLVMAPKQEEASYLTINIVVTGTMFLS